MLRTITNGLRRIWAAWRAAPEYVGEARHLASSLSGVEGSSLCWCGCGELLTPIVFARRGEPADVIALACLECHGAVPVWAGIVADRTGAKNTVTLTGRTTDGPDTPG